MPKNSNKKGKVGELELSHELTKIFGLRARRGQQYQGGSDSPDVVFHPKLSIECKRVEKLNFNLAMEQAVSDAHENQVPVVMSRMNRKPWLVTVRLDDLRSFV
jgi:hypothetical protein